MAGLDQVTMRFRNEYDQTIYFYDYDNDGILSKKMDNNLFNGEFKLEYISLRDSASNSNTIDYRSDGTTRYRDKALDLDLNERHSFDFDQYSFTLTGAQEPQTDFTPPELISINLLVSDAVAGEPFRVNYQALDVDSSIKSEFAV